MEGRDVFGQVASVDGAEVEIVDAEVSAVVVQEVWEELGYADDWNASSGSNDRWNENV